MFIRCLGASEAEVGLEGVGVGVWIREVCLHCVQKCKFATVVITLEKLRMRDVSNSKITIIP